MIILLLEGLIRFLKIGESSQIIVVIVVLATSVMVVVAVVVVIGRIVFTTLVE